MRKFHGRGKDPCPVSSTKRYFKPRSVRLPYGTIFGNHGLHINPNTPGHIRIIDVNVIDDNINQPPHDHRELPHRAVQSEAGITDGRRAVMPCHHRDAQFLEQRPGAQGNAGPRPSSCRYRPRRYHLCRRSHRSISKTSTFRCIVVSRGCVRSRGEGEVRRFVVVHRRDKFHVQPVRRFCGVLPRPLSLDRSRQRVGRVDGEECVVGWGGGSSLVAREGLFWMGAEIPSPSELIVGCVGGFSPRGVASLRF